MAIAALEEPFWKEFLRLLGPAAAGLPDRDDPANHALLREKMSEVFAGRTRDEWTELFATTDACVAPVLSLQEAASHPQLAARATLFDTGTGPQQASAPRFDRTPAAPAGAVPLPGEHTEQILDWLGIEKSEQAGLQTAGVVQAPYRAHT